MSQAVPDLANQLSASLRTNLNLSLKALNSLNSGASEPTYSYANMLWYDTSSSILKMKPEDNAAGQWISIGYFDQSTDTFKVLDDTVVTTAAGVDTDGIIGDQTTATWEAGTGTTESLVSPAKVKAAIQANTTSYTQPTSAGAVGTYAFLVRNSNSGSITQGQSIAGSSLVYGSVDAVNPYIYETLVYGLSGTSPSGTWRAMGKTTSTLATKGTVYLRIS